MQEIVKTEYKGIEIVYHEDDAKWRYELNGKERSSDRLDSAKKAIDIQPKDKTDFIPQPAILLSWRENEVVTVTSLAESDKYTSRDACYWAKNSQGKRIKVESTRLYSAGLANEQLLREAVELDKEASILNKKAEAKRKEMSPFNPKEA